MLVLVGMIVGGLEHRNYLAKNVPIAKALLKYVLVFTGVWVVINGSMVSKKEVKPYSLLKEYGSQKRP